MVHPLFYRTDSHRSGAERRETSCVKRRPRNEPCKILAPSRVFASQHPLASRLPSASQFPPLIDDETEPFSPGVRCRSLSAIPQLDFNRPAKLCRATYGITQLYNCTLVQGVVRGFHLWILHLRFDRDAAKLALILNFKIFLHCILLVTKVKLSQGI